MNCTFKKILQVLIGTFFLISSLLVFADIEQQRAQSLAWLLTHQNGDGSWGQGGAKIAATSEALAALKHSGMSSGFLYPRGLSWLANAKTDSIDSLSRQIIALDSANFDTQAMGLMAQLIQQRNSGKAWGSFNGYDSGFPDTALAVQAIIQSGFIYSDMGTTLGWMISVQMAGDSGWSYSGSPQEIQHQQIMPTAYNLIALSLSQGQYNVSVNIQRALNWLINSKQQSDGRFLDDATISTGAVLTTALSYLAIDAARDAGVNVVGNDSALIQARAYLLEQQLDNGSWNNNALHTALALRTLPSATLIDSDSDGIADIVENILGSNPLFDDARELIHGNGFASSDLNVAPIVLEVSQDQVFSYTPLRIGGTPEYSWIKTAGSLPSGISVEPAGLGRLSGTPTQSGHYPFMMNVTDSQYISFNFPVSLTVIAPDDLETDTDGDGLWSSYEIAHGSDPLDKNSTASPEITDTDKDGMPDTWEDTYNLNPDDPGDAILDNDNDGWTNIVEFQLGTDPTEGNNPVVEDDIISLSENTTVNFNVTNNDPAHASMTLTVSPDVSHGVLTNLGSGSFTYQPNTDFLGTDTFTYQLCANNGTCASAVVQLIVSNDRDGDGYNDNVDAFPDDPEEWLDTDHDGIGNNSDPDDDNDSMSDVDEIAVNRNPLFNEALLIITNSLLLD